jgi:hypothetical protein
MQAHQGHVRFFIQWIETEQLPPHLESRLVLTPRFEYTHQFLTGALIALSQTLTFRCNPIIVAARQQIAMIKRDRLFQQIAQGDLVAASFGRICLPQDALEELQVNSYTIIWFPVDCVAVCAEKAICIRERLAELKDELSQVIAGLGLGSIRP